jgi:pimeloyl-ACP methyl ester carboxylesterase
LWLGSDGVAATVSQATGTAPDDVESQTALAKWEQGTSPAALANVDKPVLVVNGDDDTMLPTISSFHLARMLPDAQLSIYPDSGHGGIFQHHDLFVAQALGLVTA